jgi:hypothetical protein
MTRSIGLVAIVVLLAVSGVAHAQIKVVKKPAPQVGSDEVLVYTWTSSWGLRDDPPDKYPLGIATHKTEAEAVAAAKAHIARTAGNGNLAVTHYLIEGEPSVRNKMVVRAQDAKELLDRVKQAKEAVDKAKKVAKGKEPLLKALERKLGDTIKEYKDMVAKSFAQVTEAKKTLTGGVASLTDAKLRQVNGLIDQYNREVNNFRSVLAKDADLGFSPLARVEPPDPKKARAAVVGTWKGVSVQGESKLGIDLVFNDDGTVTNRAENGRTGSGKWSREGDTITIRWSTGARVRWQLKDGQLGGSGTTSRGQPWSISFRKQ